MDRLGRHGRTGRGGALHAQPLQHIEHPATELLGDLGAGEHGQQVSAAEGEDSDLFLQIPRDGQFDRLGHAGGELVSVAAVDAADGILAGIAKRTGDLRALQPRLAIAVGDVELGVAEGERLHDWIPCVRKLIRYPRPIG
ncbi:hypothetical protein D3C84_943290 [compost metagenome]